MKTRFPSSLRTARKNAKLTQKELASKLGVATGTVQQWELGVRFPRLPMQHKIADALRTPWQMLFYDTDFDALESFVGHKLSEEEKNRMQNYAQQFCEQANYERSLRFIDSSDGQSIINAFYQLNDDGIHEAVKRVSELTEIERYKAKRPEQTQEKPPEEQTAPADGEG